MNVLIGVLKQNEAERRWGLGAECSKAVERLQNLLHENQTPHEYKVAVIGRFKAGKSSFVNVLLDRRLAGVDTSPETAAVTTFRAGERVIARIKFIDKNAWDELKNLYQNDPADPAAHRIANRLSSDENNAPASVPKSRHSISPNWSRNSYDRMVIRLLFLFRRRMGGMRSERPKARFSAELSNFQTSSLPCRVY